MDLRLFPARWQTRSNFTFNIDPPWRISNGRGNVKAIARLRCSADVDLRCSQSFATAETTAKNGTFDEFGRRQRTGCDQLSHSPPVDPFYLMHRWRRTTLYLVPFPASVAHNLRLPLRQKSRLFPTVFTFQGRKEHDQRIFWRFH